MIRTNTGVPVYFDEIKVPGKPTKYSRRTMTKARAFIKRCIENKKTPFVEALALELGVSDRMLFNWAHGAYTHEEFTEVYELLKTVQKLDLKQKSLLGIYESPIAKIILSAEHDVVERVKKEVSGVDGQPIQVESSVPAEQRKEYADAITKIFETINSK